MELPSPERVATGGVEEYERDWVKAHVQKTTSMPVGKGKTWWVNQSSILLPTFPSPDSSLQCLNQTEVRKSDHRLQLSHAEIRVST